MGNVFEKLIKAKQRIKVGGMNVYLGTESQSQAHGSSKSLKFNPFIGLVQGNSEKLNSVTGTA